jgi:hypothetical protein
VEAGYVTGLVVSHYSAFVIGVSTVTSQVCATDSCGKYVILNIKQIRPLSLIIKIIPEHNPKQLQNKVLGER